MPLEYIFRSAKETIIKLIIEIEFTILNEIPEINECAISAIEISVILDEKMLKIDLIHSFEGEEIKIGEAILEISDKD